MTASRPAATRIALLRGINVSGANRVPMAGLRELCEALGWEEVRTYIQSGNVVFAARGSSAALGRALEAELARSLSLRIPVIVRSAVEWDAYLGANPFPEESAASPNLVMLALAQQVPAPGAAERLRERASPGERVVLAGGALWIHYGNGAGRSRLSPGMLDREVGAPVTTRNWRTVLALAALAGVAPAA